MLAYVVRQRTSKIGIRMAFGARSGAIIGLIVRHGMRLTVMGLGVGLVGAVVLTRFMNSLLVGVPGLDPVTFVTTSVFFLAVAALAA